MMAEAKFKAGDYVFVIGFLSRTPGEISKVRKSLSTWAIIVL